LCGKLEVWHCRTFRDVTTLVWPGNPSSDDRIPAYSLNIVDELLATLPLERVRPPREVLENIMEELR
jgi:hypothetical protein